MMLTSRCFNTHPTLPWCYHHFFPTPSTHHRQAPQHTRCRETNQGPSAEPTSGDRAPYVAWVYSSWLHHQPLQMRFEQDCPQSTYYANIVGKMLRHIIAMYNSAMFRWCQGQIELGEGPWNLVLVQFIGDLDGACHIKIPICNGE